MDKEYQKQQFIKLRFEYYSTGRTLWFSDTMNIGAMLLGYAVELSLKYLLIEYNALERKLHNSHNCLDLCIACEKAQVFNVGRFSHDLLQYITDMFHQRYPSQSLETSKSALLRGHSIGLSLDMILAYDDLIIALDEIIKGRIPDGTASIAIRGAEFINRKQGRAFFHANVAAAKNVDAYRTHIEQRYQNGKEEMVMKGLTQETIAYNMANLEKRKLVWDNAPKSIWLYEPLMSIHNPDREECSDEHYARDFQYPGKHEHLDIKGPIVQRSTFSSISKK